MKSLLGTAACLLGVAASATIEGPNRPPRGGTDFACLTINSILEIPVLANDVDPEGKPLFVLAVRPAPQGTMGGLTVLNDRTVRYEPPFGWVGQTAFEYQLGDGVHTAWVEVFVEVSPPGPGACGSLGAHDDRVVAEAGRTNRFSVLRNDVYPQSSPPGFDPVTVTLVMPPEFGTLTAGAQPGEFLFLPGNVPPRSRTHAIYRLTDYRGNQASARIDFEVVERTYDVAGAVYHGQYLGYAGDFVRISGPVGMSMSTLGSGEFYFHDLPAGTYHLEAFRASDGRSASLTLDSLSADWVNLQLRIPNPTSLEVRVVDPGFQPISGATVTVSHAGRTILTNTGPEGLTLDGLNAGEECVVTVSAPGVVFYPASETLTLTDDPWGNSIAFYGVEADTVVEFGTGSTNLVEGTQALITVTRTGDSSGPLAVTLKPRRAAPGSSNAADERDFVVQLSPPSVVSFAPGQSTVVFTLGAVADGLAEPVETFHLDLELPPGAGNSALGAQASLSVAILDADSNSTFSVAVADPAAGLALQEGQTALLDVRRQGGVPASCTITCSVSPPVVFVVTNLPSLTFTSSVVVHFDAGVTSAPVLVTLPVDGVLTGDRPAQLTLSSGTPGVKFDRHHYLFNNLDSNGVPYVRFAGEGPRLVSEQYQIPRLLAQGRLLLVEGETAQILLSRTGSDLFQRSRVRLVSATASNDLVFTREVTFAPWAGQAVVTFTARQDGLNNGPRLHEIELQAVENAVIPKDPVISTEASYRLSVRVVDDEGAPEIFFAHADALGVAGPGGPFFNEGQGFVPVELLRRGRLFSSSTVNFAATAPPGFPAATVPDDLTGPTQVTFPPGSDRAVVYWPLVDDALVEPAEALRLALQSAANVNARLNP